MPRLVAALTAAAALLASGCGTGGTVDSAETARGKELFRERCAPCHGLADAGATGATGPNLDDAFRAARREKFPDDTIAEVVLGQIRFPIAPMQPDLVKGEDAEAVAAYVAAVAAKPVQRTAGGTTTGATNDPRAIFQGNCAGCHSFAAADASGTTGPNLDQTRLAVGEIAEQIANGGAQMPPFKGQLSDPQIQTLAKWIASKRRRG